MQPRFFYRLCSLMLVFVMLVLSGCATVRDVFDGPPPVQVDVPIGNSRLARGEPLVVSADINVPYQVGEVQVRLWDVKTNHEEVWTFPIAGQPQRFSFDEEVVVPADILPGNDYRLEVNAMPAPGERGGFGYAVVVGVE